MQKVKHKDRVHKAIRRYLRVTKNIEFLDKKKLLYEHNLLCEMLYILESSTKRARTVNCPVFREKFVMNRAYEIQRKLTAYSNSSKNVGLYFVVEAFNYIRKRLPIGCKVIRKATFGTVVGEIIKEMRGRSSVSTTYGGVTL